jgi:SWI/SNF-related matrix-associated actin-dependent regulator 1 of chromatin subfamily A
VIICSIKAAGVGITLTASSRVLFIELPWHPADLDQCEDRAHRIGQKDSVQCTYALGQGSIDNHIYGIINRKREISNLVTGDHDDIEVQIQNELFETLLKEVP